MLKLPSTAHLTRNLREHVAVSFPSLRQVRVYPYPPTLYDLYICAPLHSQPPKPESLSLASFDSCHRNPNPYPVSFAMQSDNRFHDSSPLSEPPSFIQRLRSSLCSSCCFGGSAGDDEVDERPASVIRSSTIWLRSRGQELQEVGGRCRNLVARIAPRHPHHHARRGSGDFGYDPLSYALNFDEGPDDDDDDRHPGGGDAYRYRNFSSRLPPSPPRPVAS